VRATTTNDEFAFSGTVLSYCTLLLCSYSTRTLLLYSRTLLVLYSNSTLYSYSLPLLYSSCIHPHRFRSQVGARCPHACSQQYYAFRLQQHCPFSSPTSCTSRTQRHVPYCARARRGRRGRDGREPRWRQRG
jgi:hypothetical protein